MKSFMENSSSKMPPSSLFDNLTDDLVLQILCRVARVSSYRTGSVCKRWLALIHTPFFERESLKLRNNHFNPFANLKGCKSETEKREELLFGYDDSGNLAFRTAAFSLSFLPNFEEGKTIEVMGFDKQLLLCRIESLYYICCPITKEWVLIPSVPYPRSRVQFGFIFDSFSRFAVLRVPIVDGLSSGPLYIFSSTTREWTSVDVWDRTNLNVVAYHGKLVWWTGDYPEGIVLYDPYDAVNPKNYWRIDIPVGDNRHENNPYLARLGVCRGSLRACEIYRKDAPKAESLIVWKLNDQCGESKWSMEYNVSFEELGHTQKEEDNVIFSVLAFDPNDEDILYLVRWHLVGGYWSDLRDVISCNLRMKTMDVVKSEYEDFAAIWCDY